MSRVFKNNRRLKAFIFIVLIAFSTSGLAANFDSGRIMPGGKVLIYRGDQQVGEITAEAPFPDGALLACDGDCAVRMDSLLLVGADKSLFSVATQSNSRELLLKKGTVYFALSKLSRPLVFFTPKGAVTAQQLIMNAAADGGLLKGYVAVTGKSAEIGVIEGGSMLISTVAGETTIQSGNKIILGQTDTGQSSAESTGAQTEASSTGATGTTGAAGVGGVAIAPIAVGVAAAVGLGIAAAANTGGGGGGADSPAAP